MPPATQHPNSLSMSPMEKCPRTESGETQLPEAITHHILSLMSRKQAAQTSVLSKYWYTAWSTRPNLYFDHRDFPNRGAGIRDDQFKDFVNRTIQRYEKLNLTIQSVDLRVKWWEMECLSLSDELILKTMQMGARDLKIQLMDTTPLFSLPKELFEYENLVRLYAIGCTIDLGVNGKANWSKLKSLSLCRVYIEGDVIWDIILGCPLIEELLLSECTCFVKVQTSNSVSRRSRMLALSANLYELRKLRCLSLKNVKIDTTFFCDLSSKYPCLKDLTVDDCFGYKAIKISSSSLERISFVVKKKRVLRANFEVPCIQKFTFSGSGLPSLSFGTSSSFVWKWESDISIKCPSNRNGRLSPSWFLKLKMFLVDLSPSRIFLTLGISTICEDSFCDIKGLDKPPIVENLRVLMGAPSLVCSALLKGLFWSCRAKLISFTSEKIDLEFVELICAGLVDRMCDLKNVYVEFYDGNVSDWRPFSSKALLDVHPFKQCVHFRFGWE